MNGIGKIVRGLAALTLPASAMFVGTADAHHPGAGTGCGQLVTANLTLTHNVGSCAGHGLVVNADNITINLNGWEIQGDVSANANSGADEAGILISGRTGVVVTDSPVAGTAGPGNKVTGFDAGVAIVGGSGNTVKNLNIEGNVGTDGPTMGEGIHVRDTTGNFIQENRLLANGPYSGITLFENADANYVGTDSAGTANLGNTIDATAVTNQDIGIRLESASDGTIECTDNNKVNFNVITGTVLDGISILNGRCLSSGNEIGHNKVTASGRDGIRLNARIIAGFGANGRVGASTTNVHDNEVNGNGGSGIKLTAQALDNDITGNTALGNNPDVAVPPMTVSPLAPPHGDLHDSNVDCGGPGVLKNIWTGNTLHVTEYAPLGSALVTPPSAGGVPDYVCIS